MQVTVPQPKPAHASRALVLRFFTLTTVLTLPLWALGSLISNQLLPGLPISSLMVICPLTAAVVLRGRASGVSGVRQLLKRAVDEASIRSSRWLATAILLKPLLFLAAYGLMRLRGIQMPAPQIDLLAALPLLGLFLLSALAEELGWMGYAYDPMERRWGAFGTALIIGIFWIVWHLVPFLQAGRSVAWIGWQSLYLLSSRVLLVWIYKSTGRSVFASIVFHAMGNLSWQLFPVQGSHYDPRFTGLVFAAAAIAVLIYAGPRELCRSVPRSREAFARFR